MTIRHLDTLGVRGNPELCIVDEWIKELPMKHWMACEGAPILPIMPAAASIFMTETRTGLRLSSLLGTTLNVLIASSALRALIEARCPTGIEFLPFTLFDPRGRPFSTDYCIVNPLGTVDCLDYAASGARYSREDPTRIRRVDSHVLDRAKLAEKPAPQLFRIAGDPCELAMQEDLWNDVQREKLTNVVGKPLRYNDER